MSTTSTGPVPPDEPESRGGLVREGDPLPEDAGRVLLPMARAAIAEELGSPHVRRDHPAWLDRPGAAFVTLTLDGQLRGCIGTLEAHRPLGEDVRANARNAAFEDPRFLPLGEEELDDVRIEVSVLSAPRPLDVTSEDQAVRVLRPGVDGVVLRSGRHRATFLPQVWEQLPDPHDFLAHLRRKAGLRPDHWDADTQLSVYTVRAWEEE